MKTKDFKLRLARDIRSIRFGIKALAHSVSPNGKVWVLPNDIVEEQNEVLAKMESYAANLENEANEL